MLIAQDFVRNPFDQSNFIYRMFLSHIYKGNPLLIAHFWNTVDNKILKYLTYSVRKKLQISPLGSAAVTLIWSRIVVLLYVDTCSTTLVSSAQKLFEFFLTLVCILYKLTFILHNHSELNSNSRYIKVLNFFYSSFTFPEKFK